jgi:glycosyltransferase involved in cell wall biosynthesis
MAKAASKIITPSNSVKTEVCETLEVNPDKVAVTPEAPRPAFRRREDPELLRRLGLDREFVLFVGTIEPRKNLRRLVDAFDQVLRATSLSPKLVIAGGQGWLMDDFAASIKQKGLEDRVCLTGYLQDEDLCTLYSSCAAFVYPSLYEGFGLPPLEAMACGCPVACSDRAALPEVVGGAARLFDPAEPEAIADAVAEVLDEPAPWVERGLERAKRFSWEATARATDKVYAELLP